MSYTLAETDRQRLAQGLVAYYDEAWQEGVRGLFDNMARANMGKARAAMDVATDSYASLKKKSNDKFMDTFQAKMRQSASLYFANLPDVGADLLPLATAGLQKLAEMIPIPVLGSAVSAAVGMAAGEVATELHDRALATTDGQILGATGQAARKMFVNDVAAKEHIDNALAKYKDIGRYVQTIPTSISRFEDAITYPASVFKVQKDVSSLNVSLTQIREHIEAMQSRLEEVRRVYSDYKTRLDTTMPAAVDAVIQGAYMAGVNKGLERMRAGKPGPAAPPRLVRPPEPGAATQLAAYVSHAIAQGIHDSMDEVPVTRGRARASAPPPPPATGRTTGPVFHRRPST